MPDAATQELRRARSRSMAKDTMDHSTHETNGQRRERRPRAKGEPEEQPPRLIILHDDDRRAWLDDDYYNYYLSAQKRVSRWIDQTRREMLRPLTPGGSKAALLGAAPDAGVERAAKRKQSKKSLGLEAKNSLGLEIGETAYGEGDETVVEIEPEEKGKEETPSLAEGKGAEDETRRNRSRSVLKRDDTAASKPVVEEAYEKRSRLHSHSKPEQDLKHSKSRSHLKQSKVEPGLKHSKSHSHLKHSKSRTHLKSSSSSSEPVSITIHPLLLVPASILLMILLPSVKMALSIVLLGVMLLATNLAPSESTESRRSSSRHAHAEHRLKHGR